MSDGLKGRSSHYFHCSYCGTCVEEPYSQIERFDIGKGQATVFICLECADNMGPPRVVDKEGAE